MQNEKNSYSDIGEQRKALYWVTFMSCGFYYVTSKSSFPLNSHLLRHQFSLFSVFLSVILPCPPPPPSLLSLLSFRNRCTEQLAPLSLSFSHSHFSCSIFPPICHSTFCSQGAFLFLIIFPDFTACYLNVFAQISASVRVHYQTLSLQKWNLGGSQNHKRHSFLQGMDSCL